MARGNRRCIRHISMRSSRATKSTRSTGETMFKRLGVFAVAGLLVGVLAVPAAGQNMSAGIQGGVTLANLGGDLSGDLDSKTGFAGGAFFALDLHDYFRLQFQGQYVQKGAKESDIDEKLKVDYIELLVPLTLTIPIGDSSIEPRLYVGPALGFNISSKFTNGESEDCKDITKSTDFGVFFGGGVDFMLGSGAIMLDVWYNLGLSNINDDTDSDTFSVKTKTLQIMAGYRFFMGG